MWDFRDWAHDYNFVGDHCDWPPGYSFEDESYGVAGQAGFHEEVDILAVLMRVCSDAVDTIGRAIWEAESLRRPLAYVLCEYTAACAQQHHFRDDGLERISAIALTEVDELLRQHGQEGGTFPTATVKWLKLLQKQAQDVAVLAHSRFIDQRTLQGKGIQGELLLRLEASFGPAFVHDLSLRSRLGNSKYQAFTSGTHFHDRRRRRRRGGHRQAAGEGEQDESWEELGEPMRINLLECLTDVCTDSGHASTDAWDAPVISSSASSSAASCDLAAVRPRCPLATVPPCLPPPSCIQTAKVALASSMATTVEDSGEPLWSSVPGPSCCPSDDSSNGIDAQIALVLKRYGINYNQELIDDIVDTTR